MCGLDIANVAFVFLLYWHICYVHKIVTSMCMSTLIWVEDVLDSTNVIFQLPIYL